MPSLHDVGSTVFLVLTLALLAGGVSVWIHVGRRWLRHLPPIPSRFRSPDVTSPRLALALVLASLVMIFAAGTASPDQAHHSDAEDVTAPDETKLDQVRLFVQQYVVTATVLTAAIFSSVYWPVIWSAAEGQALGPSLKRARVRGACLGLRCDHLPDQFRYGALGFLAALLPVMAVLLATSPLRSHETMHPLLRELQQTAFGSEMCFLLLNAAVMAPITEELMFRVVLQSWFRENMSPVPAVLCSSLLFASVHSYPDSLAIFPLALVLGTVFERRRSYLAVVTLHALFNSYNLLGTFAGKG